MAVTERLEEGAPRLDELEARVSENPNDAQPLRDLGWALYGRNQTEEAAINFEKAAERFPDDPEIYYALGLAYKQSGDDDKARKSFRKAIQLADKDSEQVRSGMMLVLAKRQLNRLEHGTWDLAD